MKLSVFAIRDAKAQTYGNPFFYPNVAVALRSLAQELNKPTERSVLVDHPEDFELFHLGEFDSDHARFELFSDPRPLCIAASLKNGELR